MDHHCAWVGNCIGMFNTKHFILMNIFLFILLSTSALIHIITFVMLILSNYLRGNAWVVIYLIINSFTSLGGILFQGKLLFDLVWSIKHDLRCKYISKIRL